jgi:hypothetical protein
MSAVALFMASSAAITSINLAEFDILELVTDSSFYLIRHQELIRRKQMTRPTRVEVNCTTGETSIIELTDAEIAAIWKRLP